MRLSTNPAEDFTFNTPITPVEAASQIANAVNTTDNEMLERMPNLASHTGNVIVLQNRSGQTAPVKVMPEGKRPGEETAWSYIVDLELNEVRDDTDETNEVAREVAARIESGDYQPPA